MENQSAFKEHEGDSRSKKGILGEALYRRDFGPYITSDETNTAFGMKNRVDFKMTSNFFIDVKYRSVEKNSNNLVYIFLETRATSGVLGWMYGRSNYVAFYIERDKEWVIIHKEQLKKAFKKFIINIWTTKTIQRNRRYTRLRDESGIITLEDIKKECSWKNKEQFIHFLKSYHEKLKKRQVPKINNAPCNCYKCRNN